MTAESAKKNTGRRAGSTQRRVGQTRNGRDAGPALRESMRSQSRTTQAQTTLGGVNGTAAPVPEVHCTLAPTDGLSLLLPTSVVAEVVDYVEPDPVRDTPGWLLGQIEWEDRQVPVFSFGALVSGEPAEAAGPKARILILKSLADSARVPYLGIVSRDIPRLLNVQPGQLVHTGDERKAMGVFCQVTVQDEAAVIPDLDRLTHLVTHAAYGALPITQVDG